MNKIPNIAIALFVFFIALLHFLMMKVYQGSQIQLFLFTLLFNTLFIFGFIKKNLYFDSFLGTFLWLGFWLKLSARMIFFNSEFHEPTGDFNYSPASFDETLLVSNIAAFGLLTATLIRRIFSPSPQAIQEDNHETILVFYLKNRSVIWMLFIASILLWSLGNYYFSIYQKGEISKMVLPFGLSGVLKWLLIFGGATISSIIIFLESKNNGKKTIVYSLILGMLETTASATSMLSRGMILNSGALIYGFLKQRIQRYGLAQLKYLIVCLCVFAPFFILSTYGVNHLRSTFHNQTGNTPRNINITSLNSAAQILLLDRWVGIEPLMAVISSEKYGWSAFKDALGEKYVKGELSYYDKYMIQSPYQYTDLSVNNFITIPGFIAYLYYPRSKIFLFFAVFIFSYIGVLFEWFTSKLSGGIPPLMSVISLTVAYRFVHFGYAPKQSYLLFGSILLNLFIIYLCRRIIIAKEESKILI